ncbi:MAG TPA: PfkB family carbohydrate kinase, partial [Thermoleophilaceae bacterium]
DRLRAVTEIAELGPREAVMTLASGCIGLLPADGHDGTAPTTGAPGRLYQVMLDPLEPVSAVGSGDAFLAGYVAARYTGREPEACLRFAVACGAESTQHFGAGVLDPREVDRLLSEVRVEQVEMPALEARR